ncbi:MAG: HAD-IA family hydrolase [Myxococcales bacterium]
MPRFQAVIFDLLTALIDSWSLFDSIAGGQERGLQWRKVYLRHMYATGAYVPYARVVEDSAREFGLPPSAAGDLLRRWDELRAWPEAREVLGQLSPSTPLAIVTNCSEELGARAAASIGVPFASLVTAERAGFYKPDPRTYRLALAELGVPAEQALFVAGSAGDVPGASGVGLRVYWHNRKGLPLPAGAAPPLVEERSLRPLLQLVGR